MGTQEIVWRSLSVDLNWGKLSGKIGVVGNNTNSTRSLRVLGIHGWLDNANTFDTLAPYLPEGTELLVLDLPGHGLSDHLPLGAHYDMLTYVLNLKRVVDECRWDEFVFLGHSMGSCIGIVFTSVFPEHVTALVSLDYISPRWTSTKVLQESISLLFKGEELRKQRPPIYTEEQVIERLIRGRTNIDRGAAYVLLPRSARQVEGGYVWTHDPRARAHFQVMLGRAWHHYAASLRCPMLMVTADHGICSSDALDAYKATLDIYRRSARWCDMVAVAGYHHVHLTHPERVAAPLAAFLDKVVKETAAAAPPLQARL